MAPFVRAPIHPAFLLLSVLAGASRGGAEDGISVRRDEAGGPVRIRVPVRDDRVLWRDILRGVARAKGFDDEALAGALPSKTLRVKGVRGRLLLAGVNLATGPSGVRFRTVQDAGANPGEERLEIVLDRAALLASKRRMKRILQGVALRALDRERRRFGIEADDGWKSAPEGKPLVVLIHGIHASPERVAVLLDEARAAGFPCATFRYPNDQPVARSAELLSRDLRGIAGEDPGRRVALVTHSMGGLVAREALENPELDPGNVDRLLMIAPPNRGSVMAHFAFALEVREHAKGAEDRRAVDRLFDAIEDGLSEASEDLEPGSVFIERLNARARNPEVEYSIFLGTRAPCDRESIRGIRKQLEAAGERNRFVRFLGAKLDGYLADLDEVVRGRGDGAVSVERGRLEGVSDVVVMEFDHASVFTEPDDPESKRLRGEILERLRRPSK